MINFAFSVEHFISAIKQASEEGTYIGVQVDLLEWMTYWTMIGGRDD